MADDVWAWCDKAKAFGRTVTVKVKFADFRQVTAFRAPLTALSPVPLSETGPSAKSRRWSDPVACSRSVCGVGLLRRVARCTRFP
jgi:hypothetical protein